MDYRRTTLRFECTRCGACCRGGDNHYIAIRRQELEVIAAHLGITGSWFRRHYTEPLARHYYSIRFSADGNCMLLDEQGQCRVYPVRPVQCQTYPYWPEILHSEKTWRAEQKLCEGIDRGNVVPVNRIINALNRQQQYEADDTCDQD